MRINNTDEKVLLPMYMAVIHKMLMDDLMVLQLNDNARGIDIAVLYGVMQQVKKDRIQEI